MFSKIIPLLWKTSILTFFFKISQIFWLVDSKFQNHYNHLILSHLSHLSHLSPMLLIFFSPLSCLFNLFISNSHSLNFPNRDVVVIVQRSLGSEITDTLGCQLLSRNIKILMFNSSLSNSFPNPIR